MARLTQEQYDYRREAAAQRNSDNEEIAIKNGITEEQADLISEICGMRHEIHCSGNSLYHTESGDFDRLWSWVRRIDARLIEFNLPLTKVSSDGEFAPDDCDRYNGVIEDTDEAEQDNLEQFHEYMSEINSKIESFLRIIDEKYDTSFAPTGALRI